MYHKLKYCSFKIQGDAYTNIEHICTPSKYWALHFDFALCKLKSVQRWLITLISMMTILYMMFLANHQFQFDEDSWKHLNMILINFLYYCKFYFIILIYFQENGFTEIFVKMIWSFKIYAFSFLVKSWIIPFSCE